jgi:hypothetical protein
LANQQAAAAPLRGNAPAAGIVLFAQVLECSLMEITIGMRQVPKEITLNVDQKADEVRDTIAAAIAGNQPLITLTDKQGRTVIVPTAALAYVEVGPSSSRRVGFGA